MRRKGVGQVLMEKIKDLAQKEKAGQLCFTVDRRNAHAIKFYEELGAAIYPTETVMIWDEF
jgi:GNAT superfamily N-acetyltransferase